MEEQYPMLSREEASRALSVAMELWRENLPEFTDHFQTPVSTNGFYRQMDNLEWTTGFCTGELWLCYEHSQDEAFRQAAEVHVRSFLERIRQRVQVEHHDMGFLYTPSCVAAYKLTGNPDAKKAALMAADCLMERFQPKGNFIQAWGSLGARDNYRLIVDCLLNLPLLYWASQVTGEERYREAALRHTETSVRHLVRDDYSIYHTFFFDPDSGAPVRGATLQGYRDGSAWARGQAWGIYGLALSYRYTQNPDCMDLFHHVAKFYWDHLPQDLVPYWDLDFSDGDGQPKDGSAAAIAACGMLEMSAFLPQAEAETYRKMAARIAYALNQGYAVRHHAQSNGLLLHGVYAKASPYNPVQDNGVDECNTWGDYFWMELLTRLTGDWELYW
jgi:unsaturated chondroitin disaccharide hydrolase